MLSKHQTRSQINNNQTNQGLTSTYNQTNNNHIEQFNNKLISDQQQKITIYEIASKLSAVRNQGVVTINMNLLP